MNNWTTCQYDHNGGQCQQGHIRWNKDQHWIIENCHAWKEKERCKCYYFEHAYYTSTAFKEHFNVVYKKCGRIIE